MAQAWDVLRGDTSHWANRFFFLEVIQKYGQPVLDVGCRKGRLLLDYLQIGIDIGGVDNSPEMLAILSAKKLIDLRLPANLHQQYMETLELPRQYGTILDPLQFVAVDFIHPKLVDQALKRLIGNVIK